MIHFIVAPSYARYRAFIKARGLDSSHHEFAFSAQSFRGYSFEDLRIMIVDVDDVDRGLLRAIHDQTGGMASVEVVYCDSRSQYSDIPNPNHEKRVILKVKGTGRMLAVLNPNGVSWHVPDPTVEEKNALLQWLGKIRDYVDERNALMEITVEVEVEYDPKRARFRSVAEFTKSLTDDQPTLL